MSVELRTRYLGLELRSPIVASPSPLTGDPDAAVRIADSGIGALVLPSLFAEEILHDEIQLTRSLEAGSEQFAEALDFFPTIDAFVGIGEQYLERLRTIRSRVDVPVIASLNAV